MGNRSDLTRVVAVLLAECGMEQVGGGNAVEREISWLNIPEATSSEPLYPAEANEVKNLASQDVLTIP